MMELLKVCDRKTERMFLDAAREIYKNDKTWVCPLDNDIKSIFDPEKNSYHKHGTIERWILKKDSSGNISKGIGWR